MSRFPAQNFAAAAQRDDVRSNLASWYTPGLSDALGDRLIMSDNTSATSLELLRFKSEFSDVPAFEAALRQRVHELAGLHHPGLAGIRAVEWLSGSEGLALVSNQVIGRRLSDVLRDARGPQFAASLIRQLMPILDALESQGTDIAHGLITPERIVITPDGRLVLIEQVVGAALATLSLSPERLASEFGLVHGHVEGRGTSVADVAQVGYLALQLLTGRASAGDDASAALREADAPAHLRQWIGQALSLNTPGFLSAHDAHHALDNWPSSQTTLPPRRQMTLLDLRAPAAEEMGALWPVSPATEQARASATMVDFAQARRARPPADSQTLQGHSAAVRHTPTEPSLEDSQADSEAPGVRVRLITSNWVVAAIALFALFEALVIVGLLTAWPTRVASINPARPPATSGEIAPPTGLLEVTARPAGAHVTVDGTSLGSSPITLSLPIGAHDVSISSGGRTMRRTIEITRGRVTVVSPR